MPVFLSDSPASVVIIIIGSSRYSACSRRLLDSSNPFICGMFKSVTTRSTGLAAMTSSASIPFDALTILYPLSRIMYDKSFLVVSQSSTTRIFFSISALSDFLVDDGPLEAHGPEQPRDAVEGLGKAEEEVPALREAVVQVVYGLPFRGVVEIYEDVPAEYHVHLPYRPRLHRVDEVYLPVFNEVLDLFGHRVAFA